MRHPDSTKSHEIACMGMPGTSGSRPACQAAMVPMSGRKLVVIGVPSKYATLPEPSASADAVTL